MGGGGGGKRELAILDLCQELRVVFRRYPHRFIAGLLQTLPRMVAALGFPVSGLLSLMVSFHARNPVIQIPEDGVQLP